VSFGTVLAMMVTVERTRDREASKGRGELSYGGEYPSGYP